MFRYLTHYPDANNTDGESTLGDIKLPGGFNDADVDFIGQSKDKVVTLICCKRADFYVPHAVFAVVMWLNTDIISLDDFSIQELKKPMVCCGCSQQLSDEYYTSENGIFYCCEICFTESYRVDREGYQKDPVENLVGPKDPNPPPMPDRPEPGTHTQVKCFNCGYEFWASEPDALQPLCNDCK